HLCPRALGGACDLPCPSHSATRQPSQSSARNARTKPGGSHLPGHCRARTGPASQPLAQNRTKVAMVSPSRTIEIRSVKIHTQDPLPSRSKIGHRRRRAGLTARRQFSDLEKLVELRGFEPAASSSRTEYSGE